MVFVTHPQGRWGKGKEIAKRAIYQDDDDCLHDVEGDEIDFQEDEPTHGDGEDEE
jgi:hypothetical protein